MKYKYNLFNSRPYESHMLVLSNIQPNTKILEIGCATGYFTNQLKKKNCKVWGIEIDREAAKLSKKYMEKIFVGDAQNINKSSFEKHYFDYILLQDVLEHIIFPENVMMKIKPYLKRGGKIIISTPNIAQVLILVNLLKGDFYYNDKGIMDKTHVHFFTKKSLVRMIQEAGYKINKLDFPADFGQLPFFGRYLRHVPKIIQYHITLLFKNLLAGQIIVVCSIEKT